MSKIDRSPVDARSLHPHPPRSTRLGRPGRSRRLARAVVLAAALIALTSAACSRAQYTKVTRTDGSTVIGRLVAMRPDVVVLQTRAGQIEIPRASVRSLEEPTLAEITDLEGVGSGETSAANQTGPDNPASGGQQQAHGGSAAGTPDGGGGTPGAGTTRGAGSTGGTSSGAGSGTGTFARNDGGGGSSGAAAGGVIGGGAAGATGTSGTPGAGGTSSGAGSGSGTFARNDGGSGSDGAAGGGTGGGMAGRGAAGGSATGGATNSGGTGGSAQSGTGGMGGGTSVAGRMPAPGEVVIPAGTTITVAFDAALASDTARIEQPVSATLKSPIVVGGTRIAPAGARLAGRVTDVASARVAGGRGRIAIRFHTLTIDTRTVAIDAAAAPIVAQVFTREDKRKVGWGAAAGAVMGGIVSRTKKGLGIGAAAGAGGAAAAVGLRNDVRITAGTPMRLHLVQPVFVAAPPPR